MDSRLGEGTIRCQTVCPWAVRWADALGAVPGRPWDGIWHTGDVIGHTRDVLGRPVNGRIVPRTSTGQWTHYGRSRAQRWRKLTVAHIFGDESRFQLYPVDGRLRVRRLPGERFRPGCQAHRVQAGGGSVHVWGAFHNSAKSPLVLPDGYLTGVLYRGILQNTLVPFARHYFGDNYRYQDDNATPHRARVVLDFLQQGNVTKMEQPPRSPDCNPIEHLWDELGRAISSMDNPPQNLDELRQALLDKWAQIPVQRFSAL